MKIESSLWKKILQNCLLGGLISLLLGLVGMVVAFGTTYLVGGMVSMGQILLLAPFLLEAFSSIKQIPSKNPRTILTVGGLTGLLGGAVLAVYLIIGQLVPFRSVLINSSPDLYKLWTFSLPLVPGVLVLLALALVTGLIAAGFSMLPVRIRGALSWGLLIVMILGLFRDLILTVIGLWGFVQFAFLWMFADVGMTIPGALVVFLVVGGLVYWRSDTVRKASVSKRNPRQQRIIRWVTLGVLAVIVLLLPKILGMYFSEILDDVGIYILMGLGLNIVVGFAGLLDLGYVAFYAIGAYALGVLTTTEAVGLLHLTFWAALPVALIVAVFAGVVLGLPILRLRGDYLAIVTLGFGEIIRILVLSDWFKPLLGGSEGIQRIGQPTIGTYVFANQQQLFYVIIAGIIVAGFIATRLKDSHLGRSWMALREDEDVAEAMGINKVATKLLAFGTGALFSGLGGALFATKVGSVYPQSFSFIVSINILSLIIIGGLGSIPGVFVGGLVLVGLPLLLAQFADFVYLIYGASLIFMMLSRPEGLLPEARRRLELRGEESGPSPQEKPKLAATDAGH
ncbi:MAG: leucine/isoleucine/valine transporter permease subunit [Anaerolineales bacterium]|jgi:branched-chain amino acid transport system permease protein